MNRREFLKSALGSFAVAGVFGRRQYQKSVGWVAHHRKSALTTCVFVSTGDQANVYHADNCDCLAMRNINDLNLAWFTLKQKS